MMDFYDLQLKRDMLVDEKDQILIKIWRVEYEINLFRQSKWSYLHRGDFSLGAEINLNERLKHESNELENQMEEIISEIDELNEDIEYHVFKKINADYIFNEGLYKEDIEKLIIKSKNISERFDSFIIEYSLFLNIIESHLKKIEGNIVWENDLNLLKIELEAKIKGFQNHQKQSKEFKHFNKFSSIIKSADEYFKNLKLNFTKAKNFSLRFELIIDQYVEFLRCIDVNPKGISENYLNDDFKIIKNKVNYAILILSKNKKYCFNFEQFDKLNDILNNSIIDLEEMKSIFNKSNKILIRFDSTINDFTTCLTEIDSYILKFSNNYYTNDLIDLKNQIETQKKDLLNTFRYYFDFDILDELFDELETKNNYLADIIITLKESQKLSKDFKILINDYYLHLYKFDSELKKLCDNDLADELIFLIDETKFKKDNLINYQKKCYNFNCFYELKNVIDISKNDLQKFEEKFNQIKIDLYNKLFFNVTFLIQEKIDECLKLSSKLSILIDDTKYADKFIDNTQLLNNLNEIEINLSNEYDNLISIRNNLDKRASNTVLESQLKNEENFYHNNLSYLNKLIKMINQLSFEDLEIKFTEHNELFEKLFFQNEDAFDDDVRKLLSDFLNCFNKPMFQRQLKRYDLKDNELNIVKNEIMDDIINQIIVDENLDFKKLIKTRCNKFKKVHTKFVDDKLDSILDIDDFNEINEELLKDCKNLIKQDLLEGNITDNQVELKFKYYINKKIKESKQLKELEKIKKNPDVPKIKIHLTQEEINEIYLITENEILSEYGIRDNVENCIHFWANKKIRENQSEARGRLNIIKRDFTNLTQLNNEQQLEFINQIEYYINNHQIKYDDITEEYMIELSENFIKNGQIRLG